MVRRGRGDDWSLLGRARAGDRRALAGLVRRYQQPLAGYLWAVRVPRATLEPLLVETFVSLYRDLPEQPTVRAQLFAHATRLALQLGASRPRSLLLLCCLEGFSYAEVAHMLGIGSPAAVQARVRRAKQRLPL